MQQTMVKIVRKDKKDEDPKEIDKSIEREKDSKVTAILSRDATKTLAENIAGHHFYHLNYYWPGCKQAFPMNGKLQHVDKFFPFAENGPLFVDEVKAQDNRDFKLKNEVMKKLGHRYIVLKPNMTMLEAYEAMA